MSENDSPAPAPRHAHALVPPEHAREEVERFGRSFGPHAASYDRGRPSYPAEAAAWLTGTDKIVLELGAGTGKFTRLLADLGHGVYATDVDDDMLAVLREALPDVPTACAPAEKVPLPDHCVEAVVSAQAFHWFDFDVALAEISRVLQPGGVLGLIWNERDERIPWVRRLGELIGSNDQLRDPGPLLIESGLFTDLETREFSHWQQLDRDGLVDLVMSRSNYTSAPESVRAAKLAEVKAFYAEFNRGVDGLRLPYVARCFRVIARDTSLTALPDGSDGDGDTGDLKLIDLK